MMCILLTIAMVLADCDAPQGAQRSDGVRIFGHQGGAPGVSNQIDFYPDLGYVLVVLGNSDAPGAQAIATHVRTAIAGSPALRRGR